MSVTTIDFAPELFNPLFHRLKKADTRFVINYGGSGSGKSFTQTQHEVIKAIQRKETILVTRKYASTLKHSVIALTRRILTDWNLGAPLHRKQIGPGIHFSAQPAHRGSRPAGSSRDHLTALVIPLYHLVCINISVFNSSSHDGGWILRIPKVEA